MYAVFRSGGKQYRGSKGDVIRLEKIDAEEGADVTFDDVLLVGDGSDIKVGTPLLSGTSVSATVVKQGKSKKVSVVKFRRRQNYLRQHTHRQFFTDVEIIGIGAPVKSSKKKVDDEKPAKDAKAEDAKPAKKAASKKSTAKKPAAKKAASKKPAAKKAAKKKTSKKKASKKTGK